MKSTIPLFRKSGFYLLISAMLFSNFVHPCDISIGNDYLKIIDIQNEFPYI